VTVHGIEAPGVTIETEPIPFAVHTRAPSNVRPDGTPPSAVDTVVTAPAAWEGSIA
jgi:hypothetical protein